MDSGEPEESGLSPDPLQGAERALEEHEGDLIERVIALAERGIPPKATVREAMIEMHRAMSEDPEVRELIEGLAAMKLYGGGKVAENWPEWWRENRPPD